MYYIVEILVGGAWRMLATAHSEGKAHTWGRAALTETCATQYRVRTV